MTLPIGRYVPDRYDSRYECEDPDAMEREVQELVYGLVRCLKPQLVVETGTYLGATAEVIGNALEDNGFGRLVSVEIDAGRADHARRRCVHLPRVEIVIGDSLELAGTWKDIDLLLVDGGPRAEEHRAYEPFLAPGAVVLRHDVITGVPLAEGELGGFDTVVLRTARGLALSVRRSA